MRNTNNKLVITRLKRKNKAKAFRKIIPAIIIVFSLWIQISTNLKLTIPFIPNSNHSGSVRSQIISGANKTNWLIHRLGWLAGLNTTWRMFSPVDRFNWQMKFVAVFQDGTEALLPLPHQIDRTFWERNVINFRDGKSHVNLYKQQEQRQLYANYICHLYQNRDNPITIIRIDLHWQKILSPEQARAQGIYLGEIHQERGKMGEFECPDS